MEGISHEAASFAGHFKLGKLIGFYDDNHITIDGKTELTFTDDTAKRFEAYGWQVLHIADVNDLDAIEGAIAEAKDDAERPTLIITRTHIGYGSPRQDSEKAHGEALGKENVVITKQNYGWPTLDTFYVPADALTEWRKAKDRGASCHAEWNARWKAYADANPADAAELERRLAGRRPENWEAKLPTFTAENGAIATRAAFGAALNATADLLPELVGGSADLTPSNNTSVKAWQNFTPDSPGSRYVHFGIREHGMASIMNGHGAARRSPPLRRHVPHLFRLHASVGAPCGAHGRARHLRLHARLDRTRRRRADAPTDRTALVAPRDPWSHRRAPRRCERDCRRVEAGGGSAGGSRSH